MIPTRRHLLAAAATAAFGRPAGAGAQSQPAPLRPADRSVPLTAAALPDASPFLSYDGTQPGPELRLKRDTALRVTLTNRLSTPTAIDWHGLRAGPMGDRGLPAALPPGDTATTTMTPPDSGLSWFHAAALPGLPDQTAAGLRGVLIVEEAEPPVVDDDRVVMVADGGTPGDLTVNGMATPLSASIVTGGRLRLRLVNASTTRILILAIEGATPKVIAIDGQPSDLFAPIRNAVPAGPGARFELMIDCPRDAGASVRLLARGVAQGEAPRTPDVPLMVLTTAGPARAPLPPIAALPRNAALPAMIPLERSVRTTLVIEPVPAASAGPPRWRLNGTAGLMPAPMPLFSVPRGGAVTLGFDNRAAGPVPIRVQGQAMRLLHAKDDGWEPYWRDSVILPPGTVTHVAFIAATMGGWAIESAFFDQATSGLRTWFLVS